MLAGTCKTAYSPGFLSHCTAGARGHDYERVTPYRISLIGLVAHGYASGLPAIGSGATASWPAMANRRQLLPGSVLVCMGASSAHDSSHTAWSVSLAPSAMGSCGLGGGLRCGLPNRVGMSCGGVGLGFVSLTMKGCPSSATVVVSALVPGGIGHPTSSRRGLVPGKRVWVESFSAGVGPV